MMTDTKNVHHLSGTNPHLDLPISFTRMMPKHIFIRIVSRGLGCAHRCSFFGVYWSLEKGRMKVFLNSWCKCLFVSPTSSITHSSIHSGGVSGAGVVVILALLVRAAVDTCPWSQLAALRAQRRLGWMSSSQRAGGHQKLRRKTNMFVIWVDCNEFLKNCRCFARRIGSSAPYLRCSGVGVSQLRVSHGSTRSTRQEVMSNSIKTNHVSDAELR